MMDDRGNVCRRYSSTEEIARLKGELQKAEIKYQAECTHRANCEYSNRWFADQLEKDKTSEYKFLSLVLYIAGVFLVLADVFK